MARTSFYLDMRGKAKDGKGSVLISLYHNATTALFPTGIRISSESWDYSKHCIVRSPEAEILNMSLQEQKMRIDKSVAMLSLSHPQYAILTASDLKALVLKKPETKKKHFISDLFYEYVSTDDLSKGTKEIYGIVLRKIMDFKGSRAVIEDVDLKWLRAFDKYLSRNQCANGRSIYLRAFRAVCNYAKNLKIQYEYPFSLFKIKTEDTIKRSVPVNLLREFYQHPATGDAAWCRDYFFLMFFLIGMNAKDLFIAKKSQVIDGRLEYIRSKTKKHYSIRIEPEAQALLDKYAGKDENLVDIMDRFRFLDSPLKVINRGIKDIGIIPGIGTYYSRHCWATYAHEIGIPTDVISQALGHSSGNRTTLIYIKPDRSKVDEANRRVIDYLLYD
jgi:integrase